MTDLCHRGPIIVKRCGVVGRLHTRMRSHRRACWVRITSTAIFDIIHGASAVGKLRWWDHRSADCTRLSSLPAVGLVLLAVGELSSNSSHGQISNRIAELPKISIFWTKDLNLKGQISNQNHKSQISNLKSFTSNQIKSQICKKTQFINFSQTLKNTIYHHSYYTPIGSICIIVYADVKQ